MVADVVVANVVIIKEIFALCVMLCRRINFYLCIFVNACLSKVVRAMSPLTLTPHRTPNEQKAHYALRPELP